MTFYHHRFICCYVFCFILLFSVPCYGLELDVHQLVDGVNLSRTLIHSGEFRLFVSIYRGARRSPEEIHRWIEAEAKKQSIPKEHLKLIAKHSLGEWEEPFESNIALEIYDEQYDKLPKSYKYRIMMLDCSEDPYSREGEFFHAGRQKVIVYDGEKHSEEMDYRLVPSDVSMHSRKKTIEFQHLELFGRPFYRIPVGKTKLLKQETINSITCYVLEVKLPERNATTRCWIAPQFGFCLLRQEWYEPPSDSMRGLTVYDDFRQFPEGIWFPMKAERTVFREDGSVAKRTQITVKEAQLNVSFPDDFFEIDLENLFDKKVRINPMSETQIFSKPKLSSNRDSKAIALLECGPRSLLAVCRIYGIETSLRKIKELSEFNPKQGTSMAGLYQAAQRMGLNPVGMNLNFEQLREQKIPVSSRMLFVRMFFLD